MIGTAHISEESANLVRRTIKTVKPDVVMIELDPKRIGRVVGSNETLEEAGTSGRNCRYSMEQYRTHDENNNNDDDDETQVLICLLESVK